MHNLNIDTYIKEAEALEELYDNLLVDTARQIGTPNGFAIKCVPKLVNKPLQRELLRRYEVWYESCRRIILLYADHENTDNYQKFCEEYERMKTIIDLNAINLNSGKSVPDEPIFLKGLFISTFDIQVNILHTIRSIIYLTENNYKKVISADILNSELDEAEMLYEREFIRPAGIIAGIVLERYLKTLCEMNNIELGSRDTLVPMAQKIRDSDKVPDFDLAMFKSIDHLGTLRNKCAHPKEEPKKNEVRELLDKTKKITFMAFS
jgi:hypothetical protein